MNAKELAEHVKAIRTELERTNGGVRIEVTGDGDFQVRFVWNWTTCVEFSERLGNAAVLRSDIVMEELRRAIQQMPVTKLARELARAEATIAELQGRLAARYLDGQDSRCT